MYVMFCSIQADWRYLLKETIIINIIKNKDPTSPFLILKPAINQFKNIGLRVLSTSDLDSIGNFPKTLLKAGGIAYMDPENPRL